YGHTSECDHFPFGAGTSLYRWNALCAILFWFASGNDCHLYYLHSHLPALEGIHSLRVFGKAIRSKNPGPYLLPFFAIQRYIDRHKQLCATHYSIHHTGLEHLSDRKSTRLNSSPVKTS